MRMMILKSAFGLVLAYTCLLFFAACSAQTPDYTKLCNIYAGIVNQPIDLSSKEGKIMEEVQKIFPKFTGSHFVHIAQADPEQRYPFIKQIIESETNETWDCEIIRNYYATQFGKSSN